MGIMTDAAGEFRITEHACKFLLGPVVQHRDAGSFDCVVVRFADDYFAQDDRGV